MPACPRCRPSLLQAVPTPSLVPLVVRPISDNYPSWGNVFLHPGSTRKHIPQVARSVWSQCFLSCLLEINTYGDALAWLHFFMLPRCLLGGSQRGGNKHHKRIAADIKQR
eukprot:4003719-Amphidinium_carterae.1